jgi:hypothetical protein
MRRTADRGGDPALSSKSIAALALSTTINAEAGAA